MRVLVSLACTLVMAFAGFMMYDAAAAPRTADGAGPQAAIFLFHFSLLLGTGITFLVLAANPERR